MRWITEGFFKIARNDDERLKKHNRNVKSRNNHDLKWTSEVESNMQIANEHGNEKSSHSILKLEWKNLGVKTVYDSTEMFYASFLIKEV